MRPKKDQDQYWYCKKYATNPQNLLKNKLFRTGCKIFMYGVQKMRYIYLISNKQPSENKMKNITKGQHVEVIANNETGSKAMKLNQEQIERMDGLVGKDSMESAEAAIIDAMYELAYEGFDDQMIEAYLLQRLANDVRKAIKTKNAILEGSNK